MNKVHRPSLVRMSGFSTIVTHLGLHTPFGRLVTQLQPYLVVKTSYSLLIHGSALPLQHDVYAAVAEPHTCLTDILDPMF